MICASLGRSWSPWQLDVAEKKKVHLTGGEIDIKKDGAYAGIGEDVDASMEIEDENGYSIDDFQSLSKKNHATRPVELTDTERIVDAEQLINDVLAEAEAEVLI
ncbi:hypothetical protein CCACVL1_18276 [Corchorus capsularis]|uniref:Uncharacterized protein n=1 Tax=Corchorus capsularis TaxID=210143 RepID=A0A1R3HLM3_COCAP|nr:hypothetical protein CCACVL1_18276 [Corchorus capsularis]